jgi:hypothetical protein
MKRIMIMNFTIITLKIIFIIIMKDQNEVIKILTNYINNVVIMLNHYLIIFHF